ncbi:mucin-2-like isoform X2 [Dysidea avara]|uniref:mucin-2-like isoform X2 n=1 Tax=Dysidea avara TaxID=196820 RepID=UPI003325D9F2
MGSRLLLVITIASLLAISEGTSSGISSLVPAPTTSSVPAPTMSSVPAPTMSSVAAPTMSSVPAPTSSSVAATTTSSVAAPTFTSVPATTTSSIAAPTTSSVAAPTTSSVPDPTTSSVPAPTMSSVAATTTSSVPATTTSSVPATTTSSVPAPTTSSVPAPTTSSEAAPTTSSVPAPTTSSVPAPTTSSEAAPTTSSVPAPTTSSVPAPTTSSVPAPTTSSVPAPTTSSVPAPTTSSVPAPTTSSVPATTTSSVAAPTTSSVPAPTTSSVPAPTTSSEAAPTTSSVPASTTSSVPAPTTSSVPAPTTSSVTAPTTSSVPAPTTSSVPAPTTSSVPATTTSSVAAPTTSSVPASTTSSVPAPTTSSVPAPTTSSVPAPTTSSVPAPTTSSVPAPTTSSVPTPTTSSVPAPTTSSVPAPTTSPMMTPSPTPVLPPEVRIDPIDPVPLGESVSLVCRGFGTPTITYMWRNPQGDIVSTSYVYNFTIFDTSQYGYYTCEATNDDDSGSSRIEVAAPDCAYEGRLYRVGEQFQPNCTTRCFCKPGGVFECHRQQCPYDGPTCEVNGDPHYRTFDGYWHHYQGKCEYVLAKPNDTEEFVISAGNIADRGSPVSVAGFVKIIIPEENLTIILGQGNVGEVPVTINNMSPKPCTTRSQNIYSSDSVSVFCRGGYPYVSLTRGVRVFFDGIYRIKITVSTSLQGILCGLCGDYNDDHTDDLRKPDGTVIPVTGYGSTRVVIGGAINDFGDSWLVPDPTNPECSGAGVGKRNAPGIVNCSTDPDIISEGQARCSVLEQDPFTSCHDVVNVTQTIENCEFDYCCCNETQREDCYCDALSSYASVCADAGVAISNWRTSDICSLPCPTGMVYQQCGPLCPQTCDNLDQPCEGGCAEGCFCPVGQVLVNGVCVDDSMCDITPTSILVSTESFFVMTTVADITVTSISVSTESSSVMTTAAEATPRPPLGGDNNLLGLDEWQGAVIVVIASLLAIGFCIALGLMIGALCRHTRRKPTTKRKMSSADDNLEYVPLETTASVPTSPTEVATFYPKTTTPKADPLTINQLHKRTKETPNLHQEFESIPKLIITETVYVGIQDKNRVDGYLPTPDSRILLSASFPESTYINANYIKGYEGAEKYYIATQAPLPNTINDFWKMVWEQKPALIVMVEEINETIAYWPDTDEVVHRVYGLITVTVRKRIVKPDYTITTFRLVHAEEEKYIDIGHYWYKKWGAYQLPHDTSGMIAFLQEVNEDTKSLSGPIVVHCSDGLGRTGALIATDIARQQLESEYQVDVVDIATTMRKDRGGMISTKEQYAFVYQVLSDWAKSLHVLEPSMDTEMTASTEHLVP